MPRSFEGVSLLGGGTHAIYGESVYARDSFRWAALRSLRIRNWKYIEAPHEELFDLEKDPNEQSNVIRANETIAAKLRLELSRLMARYERAQPLRDTSEATKKSLESLGYLSGGSRKASLSEGLDPKDRLVEYQLFDRALDAMYSQRLDAAIHGFLQILAQDRNNLAARDCLGDAYLRAGEPGGAVREWTEALASDPEDEPAAQALGEYFMKEQDWAKARQYLQQALTGAPGDATVRFELGVVERKIGMGSKK